jgi:hypothetical protein
VPWLRLDDAFAQHPKFAGWTPAQKWAWLELLLWCAHHRTGGLIPDDPALLPRSCRQGLLERAERSGLIDRDAEGRRYVHDWQVYNGETLETRVAAYLEQHPTATANQVYRAVGGRRQEVLDIVRKHRQIRAFTSESGSPGPRPSLKNRQIGAFIDKSGGANKSITSGSAGTVVLPKTPRSQKENGHYCSAQRPSQGGSGEPPVPARTGGSRPPSSGSDEPHKGGSGTGSGTGSKVVLSPVLRTGPSNVRYELQPASQLKRRTPSVGESSSQAIPARAAPAHAGWPDDLERIGQATYIPSPWR